MFFYKNKKKHSIRNQLKTKQAKNGQTLIRKLENGTRAHERREPESHFEVRTTHDHYK